LYHGRDKRKIFRIISTRSSGLGGSFSAIETDCEIIEQQDYKLTGELKEMKDLDRRKQKWLTFDFAKAFAEGT
jgi:hypothetical protein